MRASLHSHILLWFRKRAPAANENDYTPLAGIGRTIIGNDLRQRDKKDEHIAPQKEGERQEDNIYHDYEVARISAEMPRPNVTFEGGMRWGGYDLDKLRIAGFARHLLERLPYLHVCTPHYCLKNRARCRFMFPWPAQPYQQYDANTERVALRRRLPEDDQFVVPHNIYVSMFTPSSVNVLPFDPLHGSDTARSYAAKYAAKAEKWYFLENVKDGVKDWLRCRTIGLCMAHNRLLGNRVVKSTRPVQYTHCTFVPKTEQRCPRDETHKNRCPDYPDSEYYLTKTQQYFFRSEALRHLTIEQYQRYLSTSGDNTEGPSCETVENTVDDPEAVPVDKAHRHYDPFMEDVVAVGTRFPSSAKGVPGARRRKQPELGVSRTPTIEPLGASREPFYEMRLLLTLPWHCCNPPALVDGETEWHFRWEPPSEELGVQMPAVELKISEQAPLCYEEICKALEDELSKTAYDLVCGCCLNAANTGVCPACRHAVGLHYCEHAAGKMRWRKGSLYDGSLDIERALFNLHRKLLPTEVLREKAQAFISAGLLAEDVAARLMAVIESERSLERVANPDALGGEGVTATGLTNRLSQAQLLNMLKEREANMQKNRDGEVGVPDQWRCYSEIIAALAAGMVAPLRTMVQASAGTGKSYVLTSVYLWAILHDIRVIAAAPTGIAAANIEVRGGGESYTQLVPPDITRVDRVLWCCTCFPRWQGLRLRPRRCTTCSTCGTI